MTTPTNSEKVTAKIIGGPEDNQAGIKQQDPVEDTAQGAEGENQDENNQSQEPEKVYRTASGKEFKTPEELAAYSSALEDSWVKKHFQVQNPQAIQQEAAPPDVEEELAESLFTDPKATIKKIRELGRQDALAELDKKDASKQFWENFYKTNPDLRKAEKIVTSISRELMANPENLKLPPAKGAELIAKEVRSALKGFMGPSEERETINGNPAPFLNGTGAAPKTKAPAKPVSFIEQVKSFRAKKKA